MSTNIRIEIPMNRKMRRALSSRRWEKKMRKALNKLYGSNIFMSIKRPSKPEIYPTSTALEDL